MRKVIVGLCVLGLLSLPAYAARIQESSGGGGGGASISDAVYGAGWDGDTTTGASKNALYDKIEAISGSAAAGGSQGQGQYNNAGNLAGMTGTNWDSVGAIWNFSSSVSKINWEDIGAIHIPDIAYNATTWNGSTKPATHNAVRDKLESSQWVQTGNINWDSVLDVVNTAAINWDNIPNFGTDKVLQAITTNTANWQSITAYETSLEGVMDLQDMQGAVTDGQVPDTITASNYQPLEDTLTDIADGTIAEDLVNTANPWADNEVADTITASNYLPLAGGTMTGELKLAAQGLEGTATDTLTDCSTFSATGGGIFYDDSEGKWKKCQDNVLSDMDTTGAGATITVEEDNATVDGSTANLDFLGADFDVTSSPAGEANVVIAAALTRDTEWDTESEVQTAWGIVNILLETEIDASSELLALMDDETGTGLLTFATNPLFTAARFGNGATTGGYFDIVEDTDNGTNRIRFTAPSAITSDQECLLENDGNPIPDSCVGDGTDGGSKPPKEYWWPASAILPLEHGADSIPPISKNTGTNVDTLDVSMDDSTDECRTVSFKVPSDVTSGGTVTFRAIWYSKTATTGNVILDFRHSGGQAEGASWDTALTTIAAAADATQGTVKQETHTTWTSDTTTMGWAANDHVSAEFCRDANNASDTMTGDLELIGVGVEIPRT